MGDAGIALARSTAVVDGDGDPAAAPGRLGGEIAIAYGLSVNRERPLRRLLKRNPAGTEPASSG